MRIAIVNDSPMAVETLRRVLTSVSKHQIAWIARDGTEAVRHCGSDLPDLVLMDLLMPVMDGLEATRQIMAQSPCAILIVTSTVTGNAGKVFEAMGYGALDAVNTPILGTQGDTAGGSVLLDKIDTIAKLLGKVNPKPSHRRTRSVALSATPLLAIGSSTGGPQALATLLSGLPADLPAAVVIVQHVDVQFASGLAEWLDRQTQLSVKLAVSGETLAKGKVYLAGTNDHLILHSDLTLGYTEEPRDYPYRPSVDTFFTSITEHYPGAGVAVVLTGMGRDGAIGMSALRSNGWHTIAQDQATSVIYGMPKAVIEAGAAIEVLPIQEIAQACMRHFRVWK